jgi:twitching motility protein PilT
VSAADGSGRVMVMEVGVATTRFAEAVADPEKTILLSEIVADGEYYGMKTFEQDAVRLVMAGRITVDEAEKVVSSASDLKVALRRSGYRG